MVVGTLIGYLPDEGVMEIRTRSIVQTFSVSGEVRARLNREPGAYVEWIGKPVRATLNRRKVAELDRIWVHGSITDEEPE